MSLNPVLTYLSALEQNNDRDWFHAHKTDYLEARDAFEDFLRELIPALREQDDSVPLTEPRELTFKLNRDTRFSHDKSPYTPAFRAHIGPRGKLPIPVGYYILLKPGNRSFLGGGLFADLFQNATAMVRDHISLHGAEFQEIIDAPAFARLLPVGGSALKNVPRGYDPDHPQAAYLKNKSWFLESPVTDEQLLKPDFLSFSVERFLLMQPFNRFLNEALQDFEMPRR